MKEKGLRYNQGKTKHELTPPFAQEQYGRVLTKGSEKYALRNWEKGMSWTKVMGCLKRHVLEWEGGKDYDHETGVLISAHIMTNAAFLTEYYKIFPQGDDRPIRPKWKIGLDIDDVIADFCGHLRNKFPDMPVPEYWRDKEIFDIFPKLKDEFWAEIPPLEKPPFEPHCYITARSVSPAVTEAWLWRNKFPVAPVYSVPRGTSKVAAAKDSGIDIFVDDSYNNFHDLNKNGIFCYLFDAPHNQRYDVGHKRIKSLKDIWT